MVLVSESDRALWCAVVLQARDDLGDFPVGSIEFNQAVAFFCANGEWGESRQNVAAHLGLDEFDLRRAGTRWVEARRLAAGLPPLPSARPVSPPVAASCDRGAPGDAPQAAISRRAACAILPRAYYPKPPIATARQVGQKTVWEKGKPRPPAANPYHSLYRTLGYKIGTAA
jgi:hypothetical protein